MNPELASLLILFLTFFVLLLLKVPVAFSIGIATTLTLLISIPFLPAVTTISQRMVTGLDSFALLAIPFFILAGEIMNQGGIARRMINFALSLIGSLPGGLAFVNILAAMMFGAISGSAVAAATAIGGIMTDRMAKDGYPKGFTVGVNITSASTGLIIPPSNALIVFALASGGSASVAALFLAGYIPGMLIGVGLMVVAFYYAKKMKLPRAERVPLSQLWTDFKEAFFSLMMLVVVVGGIVFGVFTATEAAAIAVVYAAILALSYKEVKFRDFRRIFLESSKTNAIVTFLIGTSMAMSWLFSYESLPQYISTVLLENVSSPILIFLIINLLLLVVGTFMDMTPALLIFTPIFLPLVTALGMSPVHFGIIMVMNLCIGLCTPPVGSLLFVGAGVAKVKITQVMQPLIPFLVAMIVVLMIVTYIPQIALWLPELFGY